MIENEYKLEGCTREAKAIVYAVDAKFGNCHVNSGFRNAEENKVAGGSKTSMHIIGEAIDLSVKNVHVIKVANFLLMTMLKYPWTRMAINLHDGYIHVDRKKVSVIPVVRFYNKENKWEY